MNKYVKMFLWVVGFIVVANALTARPPGSAQEVRADGRTSTGTYLDIANDKAAVCVEHKGYGQWVGSSRVSLADFCKDVGNLQMFEQLKRDHPEKF